MIASLAGKAWAWPFKVLRQAFHKRSRFVFMRPPFMREQLLFDKKNRSVLRIGIRDHIDYAVIRSVFSRGDYDLATLSRGEEIYARYREICASGATPLIIDAGANIGASAMYFANEFPAARVVALEPEPGNFALALANCRGMREIEVLQAGLANKAGRARIDNPGADNWAFQTRADAGGDLDLVSLNQLLERARQAGQLPFLVKIDVEGFERDIFSAHTEWVDAFQVLVIELHDWMLPGEANSGNFLRCIAPLERDFVYRSENVFSIRNPSQPM